MPEKKVFPAEVFVVYLYKTLETTYSKVNKKSHNGRFYTKDALSDWTNLGKDLKFIWLCVSSITGTRRIMRLDELSFEIRLEGCTTKDSSSGRIMRLVPVFILETHNPDELQNICPSSSRRIMRP